MGWGAGGKAGAVSQRVGGQRPAAPGRGDSDHELLIAKFRLKLK